MKVFWWVGVSLLLTVSPSAKTAGARDAVPITEAQLRAVTSEAPFRGLPYGRTGYLSRKGTVRAHDRVELVRKEVRQAREHWGTLRQSLRDRHLDPARQQTEALVADRRMAGKRRGLSLTRLWDVYKGGRKKIDEQVSGIYNRRRALNRELADMPYNSPRRGEILEARRQLSQSISTFDQGLRELKSRYAKSEQEVLSKYEAKAAPLLQAIERLEEKSKGLLRRMHWGDQNLEQAVKAYKTDPSKSLQMSLPSSPTAVLTHALDGISDQIGINGSEFANAVLNLATNQGRWSTLAEGKAQSWGDELASRYDLKKVANLPVQDVLAGKLQVPKGLFLFDLRDSAGRDKKPEGKGQVGFLASDGLKKLTQFQWSELTNGLATGDFLSLLKRTPFAADKGSELRLHPLSGYEPPVQGRPSTVVMRDDQVSSVPFRGGSATVRLRGRVTDANGRPVTGSMSLGVEDGARRQSRAFETEEDGTFVYEARLAQPGFYDFTFIVPQAGRTNVRVAAYDAETRVEKRLTGAIDIGVLSGAQFSQAPAGYFTHTAGGLQQGPEPESDWWEYFDQVREDLKEDIGSHILLGATVVSCVAIPFTGGAATPVCLGLAKMTAYSYAKTAAVSTAQNAVTKSGHPDAVKINAAIEGGVLVYDVVTFKPTQVAGGLDEVLKGAKHGAKYAKNIKSAATFMGHVETATKTAQAGEISMRLLTGSDGTGNEVTRVALSIPDGANNVYKMLLTLPKQ